MVDYLPATVALAQRSVTIQNMATMSPVNAPYPMSTHPDMEASVGSADLACTPISCWLPWQQHLHAGIL